MAKNNVRTFAIINQKGGVGKTATTINLAACLSGKSNRVLLIDLDPQANLSMHLGLDVLELKATAYDLLSEKMEADEIIAPDVIPNVDLLPSHLDLLSAEFELSYKVGREQVLKNGLSKIIGKYQFVIIDCPPYLGLLTVNALTFVEEVIIPVQTEFFAISGLKKLEEIVEVVRKRLNHKLRLSLIVPTMYDKRNRISNEALDLLRENYPKLTSKTVIRRNVNISESSALGRSVIDHKPTSYGAEDYIALTKELLRRGVRK